MSLSTEMSDRMKGFQGQKKQGGHTEYITNKGNVWGVSTGKGVSNTTWSINLFWSISQDCYSGETLVIK